MSTKEQCTGMAWDGLSKRRCSRKPWLDGYCKQHHPDKVKARDADRKARWDREAHESRLKSACRKYRDSVFDAAMDWSLGENEVFLDELRRECARYTEARRAWSEFVKPE